MSNRAFLNFQFKLIAINKKIYLTALLRQLYLHAPSTQKCCAEYFRLIPRHC